MANLPTDYKDLLRLLRAAVRQEKIEMDQLETPLETLLSLAIFHSLEAFLYPTVIEAKDREVVDNWRIQHDKALRRALLVEAEYRNICISLEEKEIWYLPLKGMVLKNYYPKSYMRQMTDVDILFDKKKRDTLYQMMLEKGFTSKIFSNNHVDDVYFKEPIFNFEMHKEVGVDIECRAFFLDMVKRLESVSIYEKKMLNEDMYIYLLAHEMKHYKKGGIGLRYLLDLHYYLASEHSKLSWDNLETELERLGLLEIDRERRRIVEVLFSEPLEQFEEVLSSDMLYRYCMSGTHGTYDQLLDTLLEGRTDLLAITKYCIRRVFPDMKWFEQNHRYLYQHKYLIPLYLLYRFIRSFFRKERWQEVQKLLTLSFLKR